MYAITKQVKSNIHAAINKLVLLMLRLESDPAPRNSSGQFISLWAILDTVRILLRISYDEEYALQQLKWLKENRAKIDKLNVQEPAHKAVAEALQALDNILTTEAPQ